jgi:hypothetical protein
MLDRGIGHVWKICLRALLLCGALLLPRVTHAAAFSLTGLTETGCKPVAVSFNPPSEVGGSAPTKYQLYRSINDGTATLVTTRNAPRVEIFDRNYLPGSGNTYSYYVVAVSAGGSQRSSNTLSFTANKLCNTGTSLSVGLLLVNCGNKTLLEGAADVEKHVFDETPGALSIQNYLKEASYGQFALEQEYTSNWTSLGIDQCTEQWDATAGDVAPLGRWIGEYTAEFRQRVEEIVEFRHVEGIRPDLWAVVTNRSLRGEEGGGLVDKAPAIWIGGGHFYDSEKGKKDFLHELGHHLGFAHTGSFLCSGTDPFPASATVDTSVCSPGQYGGWSDPMGESGYHFSTYQKYLLGWIPAADVTTVKLTPGIRKLVRIDMRDNNNDYGTRVVQVKYGNDTFMLEYRRPIGFNRNWTGQTESIGVGVYVQYLPGRAVTCGAETPCFGGRNDLWVPQGTELAYATLDRPYYDPRRKLKVRLVSRDGRKAVVEVDYNPNLRL